MATNKKAGHELVQSELLVTYSNAGGIKSPVCHRVITLPELHQKLLNKHRAKTSILQELWEPFTTDTRWERMLQHERIESTFPSIVAGAVFDKTADTMARAAIDEEEEYNKKAGWQTRSGLVVLHFKYRFVNANEKRTKANRMRLQTQLLSDALLGPSIEFMTNVPSECQLIVLVAAGAMKSYVARTSTIVRYVIAACPKLRPRLVGGDSMADERHIVGFDPQAYLRPRSAGGYAIFQVKQAQAATLAGEQKRKELARERREARRKKK